MTFTGNTGYVNVLRTPLGSEYIKTCFREDMEREPQLSVERAVSANRSLVPRG